MNEKNATRCEQSQRGAWADAMRWLYQGTALAFWRSNERWDFRLDRKTFWAMSYDLWTKALTIMLHLFQHLTASLFLSFSADRFWNLRLSENRVKLAWAMPSVSKLNKVNQRYGERENAMHCVDKDNALRWQRQCIDFPRSMLCLFWEDSLGNELWAVRSFSTQEKKNIFSIAGSQTLILKKQRITYSP